MQPNANPLNNPVPQQDPLPEPPSQPQHQPEAVAQQAFQPTPTEVVSPVSPMPQVGAIPTPAPMPVTQYTDPSQIGYVPPAATNGPVVSTMPGESMNSSKPPSKLGMGLKIGIGIIVAIIFSAGSFTLLKDTLFSGSKIEISDLTEHTVEGVTFSHPTDWQEVEEAGYEAVYTEAGKKIGEADQALFVISEPIGGNFNDLSSEEKAQFEASLKENFSDTESLTEGSGCEEVSQSSVEKTSHKNFPLAFRIVLVCSKFTGRNVTGEFRGVLAIKDTKLDLVGITAIDKTWDKSGEALEYILANFSRSN
jgi:hypothetical protein